MNSFERSFEDRADSTLERLSSQWSQQAGASREKSFDAVKESHSNPALKVVECPGDERSSLALTRLSSQWSGRGDVSFSCEQDDETAPTLLVDWKLWGVKLAVLVFIPVLLVFGGGTQHLYAFSPTLAEYCHSQALTIQEAVLGKDDLGAADSHLSLARLHMKKGESQKAIEHGTDAAKIYAFTCLKGADATTIGTLKYSRIDPELEKLRECMEISALAAEDLSYLTLASKYWLQAVSLQPARVAEKESLSKFINVRIKASEALYRTGQKGDAIKVLEGGFALLPDTDSHSILKGYARAQIKERDLNAFRHAIDLHLRLGRLYNKFSDERMAREQYKKATILRRHLVHFLAARELNKHWKPFTPYMQNVLQVAVYKDSGRMLKVDSYFKNGRMLDPRIAAPSRILVLEKLPGHLDWRGTDTKIDTLKDFRFSNDFLKLLFTARGVEISPTVRAETVQSPYFNKPFFSEKQFLQELLKVSKGI